jgi:hypothetical protein
MQFPQPESSLKRRITQGARLCALALAAALAVTGCAYQGGIERPGVQKTSWFSYLNGDDIRQACVPGAAPRTRLVYNGQYERQVRAYDLVGDGHGGAVYTARVQTPANLTSFTLGNPLAPWDWQTSELLLSPPEVQGLETALRQSGAFGPTPEGLRLHSREFYWVMIACREGQLQFNAWKHPSERWDRIVFDDWLLRFDETGVAFRQPRYVDPAERLRDRVTRGDDDSSVNFDLTVGENGFRDLLTF